MLSFITDINSPILEFIKDDPVRPEIAREWRVGPNKFIASLGEDKPRALVCVCLMDTVPESVDTLGFTSDSVTVAVFYTIWSYVPGAGVELIRATLAKIQEEFPEITRFVTLSPKTELARRFHIKNGAHVLQENLDTVNYEYIPSKRASD